MKYLASFMLCWASINVYAQNSTVDPSSLKYISKQQYQYYKEGGDPEMALVAELNNYPSPKNVLEMQKQLGLSNTQKSQLQTVQSELLRKVKEMGGFLIAEQTKLNKLFETKKINEGSLIYHTNKIGALEGEMRNAYLKANLKTREILSVKQLEKYQAFKNKGL